MTEVDQWLKLRLQSEAVKRREKHRNAVLRAYYLKKAQAARPLLQIVWSGLRTRSKSGNGNSSVVPVNAVPSFEERR